MPSLLANGFSQISLVGWSVCSQNFLTTNLSLLLLERPHTHEQLPSRSHNPRKLLQRRHATLCRTKVMENAHRHNSVKTRRSERKQTEFNSTSFNENINLNAIRDADLYGSCRLSHTMTSSSHLLAAILTSGAHTSLPTLKTVLLMCR